MVTSAFERAFDSRICARYKAPQLSPGLKEVQMRMGSPSLARQSSFSMDFCAASAAVSAGLWPDGNMLKSFFRKAKRF